MKKEIGHNEDPRKTGLKNGLRQLNIQQLNRVLDYNGDLLLDECNYKDGKYCPLAIALELDKTITNPTDEKIVNELTAKGYKIYNTRGISGEFYSCNRLEDLITATEEVLDEKYKSSSYDQQREITRIYDKDRIIEALNKVIADEKQC